MVKMEEKINLPALCGAIGWESALPFASAAFLRLTAIGDESLHDCFDRGPEAGDSRRFSSRLPWEAAKPCSSEQI